jgi:hypothetical protein
VICRVICLRALRCVLRYPPKPQVHPRYTPGTPQINMRLVTCFHETICARYARLYAHIPQWLDVRYARAT